MRKNVVVSESGITSGQLVNFFQGMKPTKNGIALYNFNNFQRYLQDPNLYGPEKTHLDKAIKLLGIYRVLTAEQWSKAWGREVNETEAGVLHFSQSVLQSAADTNRAGITNFVVVYCGAISLREGRRMLATDNEKMFYAGSTWWIEDIDDEWVTHRPKPGYYLLDYKIRFKRMRWQAQEEEIARLGNGYSRAHETIVTQGALSFKRVHSGVRLLDTTYHWGHSLGTRGMRVCVGCYDAYGWHISERDPEDPRLDLGVVLARN